MKKRQIIALLSSLVFFAACGLAYLNRQYLKDFYIVQTTEIAPAASKVSDELKLTSEADFLYQASQTKFQKASNFRAACSGIEKQAVILGCYTNQQIYIYDVSEKKLTGVKEVTAAHELLHAAYERLSADEKSELNRLLKAQEARVSDKNVRATLKLYNDLSSEDLLNEMHSIFGTELKSLSPELEQYYAQYFEDRQVVVGYYKEYQAVFKKLENQAAALKATLARKNQTKEAYENQLSSMQARIESQQANLKSLRSTDIAIAAYNAAVDSYNAQVNSYNSLVNEYKALVNEMNGIIKQINSNVTELNSLTKKLDSRYSTY